MKKIIYILGLLFAFSFVACEGDAYEGQDELGEDVETIDEPGTENEPGMEPGTEIEEENQLDEDEPEVEE